MGKAKILAPIMAATLIAGMNITASAETWQTEIEIVAPPFIYQAPAQQPTSRQPTAAPKHNAEPLDLEAFAAECIRLTNEEREKVGLEALETDATLMEMAQIRAEEVSQNFSHIRPDGSKCFTVFNEFDTALKPTGENICGNHRSPAKTVAAFMASDGHKANILNEQARYIGVGIAIDRDGKLCWTQLFAR